MNAPVVGPQLLITPGPRATRVAVIPHRRTFGSAYDSRCNNFDCLRFILATLVIWSHCFPLSGRAKDWFTTASGQIDGGSLAVDGFFVLSGFLVTQSWCAAPELAVFAKKRLLRIVPALILALAFGSLVIGPFVTPGSFFRYLASSAPWLQFAGVGLNRFLLVPGAFSTNPIPDMINAPLWSLRYEILCYALVAALGLYFKRSWSVAIFLLFLTSWTFSLLNSSLGAIPLATARLVACFAAGMLYFTFRDRISYHPALALAAMGILVATFLSGGFRAVFPIAGGYLLLFVAFTTELGLAGFGRYGDFSYGLYVLAYPIQQTLVYALGADISVMRLFLMTFLLTLALAAASWHLIEAPALAHKPRSTSRAARDRGQAHAPR